jgi:hypothetical protein
MQGGGLFGGSPPSQPNLVKVAMRRLSYFYAGHKGKARDVIQSSRASISVLSVMNDGK